jgi:hypothetical protein
MKQDETVDDMCTSVLVPCYLALLLCWAWTAAYYRCVWRSIFRDVNVSAFTVAAFNTLSQQQKRSWSLSH